MARPLDAALVFDRFVIGAGNLLAATAARRVAESPGRSYNPLVVTGAPGVGKTHLLTAIAHLARDSDPEIGIRLEGADDFVDRLTASLSEGTLAEMREASGSAALWLFDDLQALAGRRRSQEELATLWAQALARGTQLVVAVDRPLAELTDLDPRLAALLAEGLSVDLAAPEAGAVRPAAAGSPADEEFAGFLTDVSSALAAVVETAPWRRQLAEAILRWEGEGIRTRRLETALDAESAPDVGGLLRDFARDVARLRELVRTLPADALDPALLSDPDRLGALEALAAASPAGPADAARAPAGRAERIDPWFLDRARFAWGWMSLDERLIEEQR